MRAGRGGKPAAEHIERGVKFENSSPLNPETGGRPGTRMDSPATSQPAARKPRISRKRQM